MKKLIAATVLAAALVVGTPVAASASPNGYHPDILEEQPYYGPRPKIDPTIAKAEKVAGWGWLIFGGAALGSLLNPFAW